MHQIPNVGELGEQLVADWLRTQGWVILHHRWRCRWGEIDLIAQQNPSSQANRTAERVGQGENFAPYPLLTFVEVKTRSRGNWDTDGLLAITQSKQTKIRKTAELFLAEHSNLASLPCRFDVALVSYKQLYQRSCRNSISTPSIVVKATGIQVPPVQLGQPRVVAGYQLILQDYIQSAFD